MVVPRVEREIGGIARFHLNLNWGWEYYISLLVVIRIELGRLGSFVHGKAALPSSKSENMEDMFIDIVVTNLKDEIIEIRNQVFNMDLVGVRIPGELWFQLGDGDFFEGEFKKIPFTGDYGSLLLNPEIQGIEIGFPALSEAISELFLMARKRDDYIFQDNKYVTQIKRALCGVVYMTSESLRFNMIGLCMIHILSLHLQDEGCQMPGWIKSYLTNWKNLSDIWRIWKEKDGNPEEAARLLSQTGLELVNGEPISLDDLDSVLGLICI